ncbi:hypothetical protein K701_04435 [Streptomyces fradiae ATCC 10745 = DSM 40063]|uniref:Uncharacterized protein n=3 Tax=Streptomyces TaxID=1883 RepID=A0A1Y2NZ08_STRFR|nr:hypothetical protein K701_04435 [Streptomyces fradiae ATCC 10745 = DSM 40063]OSY52178.1 hypothetical protein BG846_02188 [Streptomyces fradiae ATCC 10745 = DSM 40063]QEV12779.1 hypothetical protein CP974_13065 [Streptomyces fradiae ATCC 10745 = DSM 40063]
MFVMSAVAPFTGLQAGQAPAPAGEPPGISVVQRRDDEPEGLDPERWEPREDDVERLCAALARLDYPSGFAEADIAYRLAEEFLRQVHLTRRRGHAWGESAARCRELAGAAFHDVVAGPPGHAGAPRDTAPGGPEPGLQVLGATPVGEPGPGVEPFGDEAVIALVSQGMREGLRSAGLPAGLSDRCAETAAHHAPRTPGADPS